MFYKHIHLHKVYIGGFWSFFFPSPFFFSHTLCEQLVPEWNLDVTVICQELLLATHPLNVCPFQPGSRKDVLSSFLFERCILFDI